MVFLADVELQAFKAKEYVLVQKVTISPGLTIALLALSGIALAAPAAKVTPDEAIHCLQEGNLRFSQGTSLHPNSDSARRTDTAIAGQHPSATILSCSDSRVPLEIVFDQGIGDVFAVRVAGNVCGVDETGTIEYGVGHLGTPLLIVLGHTQCGAVTAAATGGELHGSIKSVVGRIIPAVLKAQTAHPDLHGRDLVPAATEANVWQSIDDLTQNSPLIRQKVQSGELKVIGAIYDVRSGQVKWLGKRP
jgi:carbonic anhydrase